MHYMRQILSIMRAASISAVYIFIVIIKMLKILLKYIDLKTGKALYWEYKKREKPQQKRELRCAPEQQGKINKEEGHE